MIFQVIHPQVSHSFLVFFSSFFSLFVFVCFFSFVLITLQISLFFCLLIIFLINSFAILDVFQVYSREGE